MSKINLILVNELCKHYQVKRSFFSDLHAFGLIEILTLDNKSFIHEDKVTVVDKIIRIQNDLNLNMEGIDTMFNLLEKINELQAELNTVTNRLRLYED
jgi:uncharacterized membrane-anchored protein